MTSQEIQEEIAELFEDNDFCVIADWTPRGEESRSIRMVFMPESTVYQYGEGNTSARKTVNAFIAAAQFVDDLRPAAGESIAVENTTYKVIRTRTIERGYVEVVCERIERIQMIHQNQIRKG